jgi:hypothetical protein
MAAKKPQESLEKKSLEELKELLERHRRLLSNKSVVKKLPDQGKRINEQIVKIQQLIGSRQLRAENVDPETLIAFEWNAEKARTPIANEDEEENSDDENAEPSVEKTLKMLAAVSRPEKKKIVRNDLAGLELAFTKVLRFEETHAKIPIKPKFKPNHLPDNKQKFKSTEKSVLMVTLQECVALQRESEEKLRQLDLRSANRILAQRRQHVVESIVEPEVGVTYDFTDYRDTVPDFDDEPEEECEDDD